MFQKFLSAIAHITNTTVYPVYRIASYLASPCSGSRLCVCKRFVCVCVCGLVLFVSPTWTTLLLLLFFYGILALTRRSLSSLHGLLGMRATTVNDIMSNPREASVLGRRVSYKPTGNSQIAVCPQIVPAHRCQSRPGCRVRIYATPGRSM